MTMVPGFKTTEIKPAKTVGQRLKEARQKRNLSLGEAEQLTKVKLKYLKALEQDRHDLLPTEVYSLGFLRCYGEVLHLNTKKLLEQYQLERKAVDNAKGKQQLLVPTSRFSRSLLVVTPKTLFTFGSIILVAGLLLYIALGVNSFLAPPQLTISQPKADSIIPTSKVTVAGETDPTANLTINGELIALAADGHFKQDIAIIPGLNTLEFVAINRVGKVTKRIRKILADYQASPSPNPDTTPSPSPNLTPTPTFSPTPTSRSATSPSPTPNSTQ